MFGTPVTAAVFVLEVICVGTLHYGAFLPCMTASFTASVLSKMLGAKPMGYPLSDVPAPELGTVLRVGLLAALCAGVGILLCLALRGAGKLWSKVKNPYLRIAAGGIVMAVLVEVLGLRDYAGAGTHMIAPVP